MARTINPAGACPAPVSKKKKKKKKEKITDQIKNHRKRKSYARSRREAYCDSDFIPWPSTLLNLACTDHYRWGAHKGKMVNVIGDSSSGKTSMCYQLLAEAANDPLFDNYRLIMDDVENADEFDVQECFGTLLAERIEPPAWIETEEEDEDGDTIWLQDPSETIEEFWINIMDAIEGDQPFIYILDSLDALDAKDNQKKFDEMRKAYKEDKKAKGSYGMAVPKGMSALLRGIKKKLKNKESILIIISQTRDKIEKFGFGKKKTRSGGKALKFYCTHEIWLAMIKQIKSKGILVGNMVEADVSKNKITGKRRIVEFPIYESYGVDDTRSCIDYLLETGHWKKKKNTIIAKELRMEATMEKLIDQIERKGKIQKLRRIVGSVWKKIEEDVRMKRRAKYK